MSDEFASVDENTQPGKLRQLYEQALATIRQKDQELDSLKTAQTESVVTSTWDKLEVPDFVRGFYNGEKTPDAITQWWEASKGFFNIQATEEQGQGQQQEQETEEQRAHRDAAERYQEATSLGSDAVIEGFDAVTAKAKQAAKNLSGADLAAAKLEFYKATGLAEY